MIGEAQGVSGSVYQRLAVFVTQPVVVGYPVPEIPSGTGTVVSGTGIRVCTTEVLRTSLEGR